MCSIFGYEGLDIPAHQLEQEFAKTKHRGPDDTQFVSIPGGYLGFHRLSIMGLTDAAMQPFVYRDQMVICNGELFGFRILKKELESTYSFKSDSDCEIILPLYERYGLQMFNKLDAEFAMILFDPAYGLIAARDPIGIRPLYYGYSSSQNIMFASEAISLVAFCQVIYPFPPGHYYVKGQFIPYTTLTEVSEFTSSSIDEVCSHIHEKLVKGIEKRLDADAPLGFLLSGGLDSSLVCAIAAKSLSKPIKTFAIGMSTDAIDLKYAAEVATYIHSDHQEVIITEKDVFEALEDVIRTLGSFDITTIRASIGMYLICKYIHEHTDVRVLLTGEISDELFGYKYTDFAPSAQDFQLEAKKRIDEIHQYDVLRADRCISRWSLEARVPFGDLDFVRYVMSIDPQMKMNTYGQGKYLLRKAFEGSLLPKRILYREKAAFSDAVGHSMVDYLKAYANTQYTDEEFEIQRQRYLHATPFTKESLLYRTIFERY
ncbi:MAG: asparagine synthase B, partial [Bacilli bacterium]